MTAPPTALTIAGSDSGGSAGMHADLRTFFACGVHGMTAVTAVTVQNTTGVSGVVEVPAETVAAQIDAVASDIGVGAAKTGMLASAATIDAMLAACDRHGIGRDGRTPFVVDPVAAARSGEPLLHPDALDALRNRAFPRATLVTPNLDEVRLLTGIDARTRDDLLDAAKAIYDFGPEWVLIKSGHLPDDPECVDLLFDGTAALPLPGPRYATEHTHGAGDVFASAITAALAKGASVPDAVRGGKRFVTRSVADAYPLGSGVGPVSTFWRISPRSY
ncbi:bifunctional hydroxymethylpyrimidine kinase/phosphomethylpyrimidine kinase [Saccharopolyspora mangrovi]|uniref:Bifunctional hydroxymethylpyrimidine kinase/phosphomethylpyrimidine kinase n=1 Tax=Saccharopolyspora mangrovi TaxID=3082379 RepID=A0ABU6ACR4_9PSEU|nr:bifunctional hydroxymethylpyrimidine kinase/phosphomethylpyrimidine kinase [Saccharopolyspora sp. S2-29]MEB3369326.1 bifunctional hydroxymethylpyrimidine kinase/phosphomethylpyrimidine kinase [Saccharopolyspora sp. S2-29]